MKKRFPIAALMIAIFSTPNVEAGLIADASFETPIVSTNSYQYLAGNVDAWTYTQYSGIYNGTGGAFAAPSPVDGVQAAILQSMGSSFGSISQSVSLTAGNYDLSFLESNRNVGGFGNAIFSVSIDGYSSGAIHAGNGYTTFDSGTFRIAASGTYTLTFSALGGTGTTTNPNDYTTFIDRVNLVNLSSESVPEPSSLSLCAIGGLMGWGLARIRRKRTTFVHVTDHDSFE